MGTIKMIYNNIHASVHRFEAMLNTITQKMPALFVFENPHAISPLLKYLCKEKFSWHWRDTERSFNDSDIMKLTKFQFSYLNRMELYFGHNQLEAISKDFSKLLCTWDSKVDLFGKRKPCFILAKFIKNGDELDMITVFRNRDLLKRAIPNWYQLGKIMETVAKKRKLVIGHLYDFNMQVFYKPEDMKIWRKQL
jgi:hypothetical protein